MYVCMYVCMYALATRSCIESLPLIFNKTLLIPYKGTKDYLFLQILRKVILFYSTFRRHQCK